MGIKIKKKLQQPGEHKKVVILTTNHLFLAHNPEFTLATN